MRFLPILLAVVCVLPVWASEPGQPVHLTDSCSSTSGSCTYSDGVWVAAIEGFATTFEILQTYNPSTSEIGFRVPYMPEGFQHADWFDAYHGDLATVGDWSQAQPLHCGYPATSPSAGDYLTVSASQIPAPGQGFYYVTAVNFQGQHRYGRKASGGVLSGRDSAVLPACN